MLNDKALIEVCLITKETTEKISQDLSEIGKSLKSIYPLSSSTCHAVDELKEMITDMKIKLNNLNLIFIDTGLRSILGIPPKPLAEEEEAPF